MTDHLSPLLNQIRVALKPDPHSTSLSYLPNSLLFPVLRPLSDEDHAANAWSFDLRTPIGRPHRFPKPLLSRPLHIAFGSILRSEKPRRAAPLLLAPVSYDPARRLLIRIGPNLPNKALIARLAAAGETAFIDSSGRLASDRAHSLIPDLTVGPFLDEFELAYDALDPDLHPEILSARAARLLAGDLPFDKSPLPNAPEVDLSAEGAAAARESRLDPAQAQALAAILAGRDLIVDGPPGCGKSHLIATAATRLALAGRSVLVSATIPEALQVARRRIAEQNLSPDTARIDVLGLADAERAQRFDYDVLILDECSKMTLAEAIRLAIRARQLILVGDDKQIQPFDAPTEPLAETVLSAIPNTAPKVMLRYHYRSRVPSLIAPSNIISYKRRLRCVPPPKSDPQQEGLLLRHIPSGRMIVTPRGAINPREALGVANHIVRLATSSETAGQSLAVIAFTAAHAALIEKTLAQVLRESRVRREQLSPKSHEPLAIWTPRQAQGQERDRVIVSLVCAREPDGQLPLVYPPLADRRDCPLRRVNVAMSRARIATELFSSLTFAQTGLPPRSGPPLLDQDRITLTLLLQIATIFNEIPLKFKPDPAVVDAALAIAGRSDAIVQNIGAIHAVQFPGDPTGHFRFGLYQPLTGWTEADCRTIPAMFRLKGWTLYNPATRDQILDFRPPI